MKTVLTGVKPTGHPHLGNYLGAIRPALDLAGQPETRALFFIADYHSLTAHPSAKELRQMTYDVAATWIACGLDPKKATIYRQSDVPEVFELAWILACFTPKGFMNRAHAYKAKVQENEQAGRSDQDFGVNMGLYSYPILMAADILLFNAYLVPVGEDQIQHIEFARDMALKFNNAYGEILRLPDFLVSSKLVVGLDGRKMSKSYNNTIPLFDEPARLRKAVMRIKTDSTPPEAPKDPDNSILFDLYREVATEEEARSLADRYRAGISWGAVKEILADRLESIIKDKREVYRHLMADTGQIESLLAEGGAKARAEAREFLRHIRVAIGTAPPI